MTSRDFGFLTLRNTTAYQPTGNPVPPNNIFVTSTNGTAIFSNNVSISTLTTSTLNTSSLITPIQLYNSTTISDNYGKTVLLRSSTISTVRLTGNIPSSTTSVNFINWSGIDYNISTVSSISMTTSTLLRSFYIDGLGWIAPSFYRN
jgi:hypothetical protein